MKKLYNLFAYSVLAVAAVFTSCKPLDKTFDGLGPKPVAKPPVVTTPVNSVITLEAADYALLPSSNYASTSHSFLDSSDALNSIPVILKAKYPAPSDKSTSTVTFGFTPPALFTATNNLISAISYTATDNDYASILGQNPKYKELTSVQAETILTSKGLNKEGSEVMFTYIYYESGVTSKATTVTHTFIYLNGAWIKCYVLTAEQFASVGNTFGDFSSSDDANIPSYLNVILNADLGFAAKARPGNVVYVAYKYYAGGNYQHITALVYDGSSYRWVTSLPPATVTFSYTSSTTSWSSGISNATPYTLVSADYTAIAGYTDLNATAAAQANLKQFGDFSLSGATAWTDDQITNGIAELLKAKFSSSASKGQMYVVTYEVYSGGAKNVTKSYTFDGTKFVSGTSTPGGGDAYTMATADYTAISKLTNTGATASAISNLAQFGDFSLSGASAWTNAQIAIGIATILKQKYPSATTNQQITVTYEVYSGGASNATMTFKFDGTKWTAQ